ncbi:uncharacterized protein LOC143822916 [Paroedura picta]|uniref:uncharacterized protein LOC143822916 n=1 Tax=Paroedura picta TaxID=143630 RepID=UPI0040563677
MTLFRDRDKVENEKINLQFTESTIKKHTYCHLTYDTHYCVKVKAKDQPTEESIQCIKMPGQPASKIVSVTITVIVSGLILLSITVGVFFKCLTMPDRSKTTFPKSLTDKLMVVRRHFSILL